MSYKKDLIRFLDRPGGRFLLGKLATLFANRAADTDVEIFYIHDLWTHRAGGHLFPDGRKFSYTLLDFRQWERQWEAHIYNTKYYWLQHYCPQVGQVVVDVGAGRGEDTLSFSQAVGTTGRVIAIEADPESFEILKAFCRLNHLDNVTMLNVALLDRPGRVRIAKSASSWTENSVECVAEDSEGQVEASTLDEICVRQNVKQIDFLKMNIEGSELAALTGMESIISGIRQICVACHDFRHLRGEDEKYSTRAFVIKFLTERGFSIFSRPEDPRDYVRDHIFGLRP